MFGLSLGFLRYGRLLVDCVQGEISRGSESCYILDKEVLIKWYSINLNVNYT